MTGRLVQIGFRCDVESTVYGIVFWSITSVPERDLIGASLRHAPAHVFAPSGARGGCRGERI